MIDYRSKFCFFSTYVDIPKEPTPKTIREVRSNVKVLPIAVFDDVRPHTFLVMSLCQAISRRRSER